MILPKFSVPNNNDYKSWGSFHIVEPNICVIENINEKEFYYIKINPAVQKSIADVSCRTGDYKNIRSL